jgi:hypothetical protein
MFITPTTLNVHDPSEFFTFFMIVNAVRLGLISLQEYRV